MGLQRLIPSLLAVCLLMPEAAWSLPNQISQVGFVVTANGTPYRDQHEVLVQFYDTAERGRAFYEERHAQVEFYDGHYAIAIGSEVQLNPLDFLREQIFVQITIDGEQEVEPRIPLFKVPAAMVADLAENVRGEITPSSVRIGDQLIIDENGRWVGDPTGLQGPAGPPGDAGPEGPRGPRGPAGAAGGNADPAAVVPLVIADLIASPPDDMPYLRKNSDDSTTGNVLLDGGSLTFGGECCRNVLNLGNNRIDGVDSLRFNDPGPNEGIAWQGSQAKIYVAPADDQNGDGQLRLVNDDGVRIATWATVDENLGIGTASPNARLDVRGGIKLANTDECDGHRAGTLRWTGAALQICDGADWQGFLPAGANLADLIQNQDGDGSGVDADRIDGVDSSQFMRGDGNTGTTGHLGVGTRNPAHPLHVVGTGTQVFENSADDGVSTILDLNAQPGDVTMGRIEAGKEADFGAVAGRDSYLAFGTSQDGVTTEKVRIDSAGQVGIGTDVPGAALDVAGVVRARQFCDENGANCTDFSEPGTAWNRVENGLYYGAGSVGINVEQPEERLHINGHALIDSSGQLRFRTNEGAVRGFIQASEGSPHLDIATSGGEHIAFRDGGTDGDINLFIHGGTGHVGIGTASPEAKLDLRTTGTTLMKIQGEGNGWVNAGILLQANDDTDHRGLGVYMQNVPGQREWFMGNPYNEPDMWMLSRVADRAEHHDDAAEVRHALMVLRGNGRLGLGTPQPQAHLHLRGTDTTLRISTTDTGDARLVFSDEGETPRWSMGYRDAQGNNPSLFAISESGTLDGDRRFVIQPGGNVGVGENNPQSKLHVNGTIRAEQVCDENGQNCTDLSEDTGSPWEQIDDGISYRDGNVGIGNASPESLLHIGTNNRGVKLSGWVGDDRTDRIGRFRFDNDGLHDVITLANHVTGEQRGAPPYGVGMRFAFHDDFVAGRIRTIQERAWDPNTAATKDAAMTFETMGDGQAVERLRINSAGNVGINTNSPHGAYGLDLRSPGAGALIVENNKPIAAHGANGGNYGLIRLDASNRVRVGDSQEMTIQGGRVGIGSTSLQHFKLIVDGDGGTDGHSAIFMTNSNNTYVGIGAGAGAERNYHYLTARHNGQFAIHRPSVGDRLTINENGNVGIGTSGTTIRAKLHVKGEIATGDHDGTVGAVRIFDTGNNSMYTYGSGANAFHTDMAGTGAVGRWDIQDFNMNLLGGGGISLGSQNRPDSYKLYVHGGGGMKLANPDSHSVLYWVDSNNGSADLGMDSGSLRIRTTGGQHPVVFYPGDQGEKVRFDPNGNVGIGTNSPQAKLQVDGGIQVGNQEVCNANFAGTIRWTGDAFEGCNGEEWTGLGGLSEVTTPQFAGILGFWDFEGNYNDVSGNGQNGSAGGNARLENTGVGQSVRFRGAGGSNATTSFVALPSIGDNADAITVSAWVRSASAGGYGGVWQIVSHYSAYILGTGCWDCNNMCFIIHSAPGGWRYGSCYEVPNPDQWHHFVGTYDRFAPNGEKKKLYVDGVLRDQNNADRGGNGPTSITNDGGPVDLGHRECCDHGNFNGWMDEVQIYDRALTAQEVRQLYDSYEGRIQ